MKHSKVSRKVAHKSRKVAHKSRKVAHKSRKVAHKSRKVAHKSRKVAHKSRKYNKKGGLVTGALSAAKTALLPYLMYKAQKKLQHKNSKK
jgi:hypothetical protein